MDGALLTPILLFARGRRHGERGRRCDRELDPAIRTREDLALDHVVPLELRAALRTLRHFDSPFTILSMKSTCSACFDREYFSSPMRSRVFASWIRTASGAGPPGRFRRARDVRGSRTSPTFLPNLASNSRSAFAVIFPPEVARNFAIASWASRNGTPRTTRYSARSVASVRRSPAASAIRATSNLSDGTAATSASRVSSTWLAASKTGALSSWRSRLYARGRDLSVARRETRSPVTRAAFARASSATSGFRFWGIRLLPPPRPSEGSRNANSLEAHWTNSSPRELRWTAMRARSNTNSAK